VALSFGCDEPLSRVELVDKTRVVAARVEVEGDPGRAAPLPGENVTVRVFAVAPEPDPEFAFGMSACVALDSSSTVPICAGPELASNVSLAPVFGEPTIDFEFPADATGNERLAVLGRLCADGVALPSEDAARCDDGSDALDFAVDFAADDGAHPNTNPIFQRVTLDGADFPEDTAATTDCALLPSIPRGSRHTVRVELDPASRDPLPDAESGQARESLLLSYFVTSGELDHAWSAIESTAPNTAGAFVWTAPGVRDQPLLARVMVVARDGRGGSNFLERRVCVQP
jgi:hypothetical protein